MKEKWVNEVPNKGDIIRIKYHNFYHYGIYLGNDDVIEFGRPNEIINEKDIKIHIIKINEFCIDTLYQVRKYSFGELLKKNNRNKVCKIALNHLGEGNYNIIYNNCEHFVNLCVFNKKTSTQVNNIRADLIENYNNNKKE